MATGSKSKGEEFKNIFLLRKKRDACYNQVYEICKLHLDKNDPGVKIGVQDVPDLKDKMTRDIVIATLKTENFTAGEMNDHRSCCGNGYESCDGGSVFLGIWVAWDGSTFYDKLPFFE